ncbi:hypothetical protein EV646_110206 [Kribbella antiqua]|uniref:Uncharacterized protein n=2 Tax=Kribbella antiqua TaxID=2512217 RepID=A0A4R2IJF9_9ACTN|nr:hypothetical protein EV646_110206 [Kribbella antiqua]
MSPAFSAGDVSAALVVQAVAVDVLEMFAASAAEVARLRILFADRPDLTVIGKHTIGAGAAGARREVRFFEQGRATVEPSSTTLAGCP